MALICLLGTAVSAAAKPGDHPKLDRKLNDRAAAGGAGTSRVIVVLKRGANLSGDYDKSRAKFGGHFNIINSDLISVPNTALRGLANNPNVLRMHWDRPTHGAMNRAAVTLGARAVQQQMGFNGAGVGVAIIDSGITGWHDDLTYLGFNPAVKVVNGQRVTKFVDFVNGQTTPYDDYGHGTHVAGIIAGNGLDSLGARAGIAPAADLVVLKALDGSGGGYISNAIAALDWVAANHAAYNIRVVNLSIGASVRESYNVDPFTLAAKAVVDQGVVVVAAAGNLGTNPKTGQIWYGGITAPGNAPWVLTVGADSHMGTITRTDDQMTSYSSRGPTAVDYLAKPDVVAPGTGIASLSSPGSYLYVNDANYLLSGSWWTSTKPYLSLTGTSMAAPMVAGTVALMFQANPNLTPNLAKAIIEYTAQDYGYNALTQGAGFLNSLGAVQLARYLATAPKGSSYPHNSAWSETVIWGNRKLSHGLLLPGASAFAPNVVWGSSATPLAKAIELGIACDPNAQSCDNIVWGSSCDPTVQNCDNIVWGSTTCDPVLGCSTTCDPTIQTCNNIVWGSVCDPTTTNCGGTTVCDPTIQTCNNIVWGSMCGPTQTDCANTVWGSTCDPTVQSCDNLVWGTTCDPTVTSCDNIVWGSSCDPTVQTCDNIVWGSSVVCDPTVQTCDNIVWGSSVLVPSPLYDDPAAPTDFDSIDFSLLFDPADATSLTGTTAISTTTVSGGAL